MRKVVEKGWEVVDGVSYKRIRKLSITKLHRAETKNIMGAVLMAKEAGCDVLAFARDRDGTRSNTNEERQRDVELGVEKAQQVFSEHPDIIGGMAIEKLESWLLALSGQKKSEQHRDPEKVLEEMGIRSKNTAEIVNLAQKSEITSIPKDAESLHRWLERAKVVLSKSPR